ncbi:MAG: hypothetical protein IJA05_06770 [Oscillospiraceae bacterium]|nr:hypothetical protein [Oscillospiraceae bacterium]
MITKSQAKRKQDIKTKLMAAIAMLLVSSIMMVSSTYAWFTLSTAPEVTGIQTAVGANGNLEMALVPTNGDIENGIKSEAGDSLKSIPEKNITWGNLVDLGYSVENANYYGLDRITLYPSRLNAATEDANKNPLTLATTLLQTPAYGADGRVSEMKNDTVTSTFVSGAFPQNNEFGVRAVGVASGMTDRQLAYRNAISSASTSVSQAKSLASDSLKNNGDSLANIAVKKAMNPGATYNQEDVASLLAIVDDLLGTKDENGATIKVGVLQHIENAYRSYIVAYAASTAGVTAGIDDNEFKVFQGVVNSAATLNDAVNDLKNTYSVDLPDTISGYITALNTSKQNVEEAKSALKALTGDAIAWSDLNAALTKLANIDAMTINNIPASEAKDKMSEIVNSVAGSGITVAMSSGGGVYADVADHCGNYTASIVIDRLAAGGLELTNVNARMETKATAAGAPYLTAVNTTIAGYGAPSGEGGQVMPISDMYGYIIDLAFRTNAAGSNLLLQTEATGRIYENGSEETMGHGSTMTFQSTTNDFTITQVKELMKAIRLVFFTPDGTNSNVLATAKLDMTNDVKEVGGNTVTANLYIYELIADGAQTYVPADTGATHVADDSADDGFRLPIEGKNETPTHGKDAEGNYVLATDEIPAVYVQDATADNGFRKALEGETATHKVSNATGSSERLLEDDEAVITALGQNIPQQVSVLVYLDGEKITNADVAATASTSVTGSLNLQFSSSANLVPMNYTDLMAQSGSTDTPAQGGEGQETNP